MQIGRFSISYKHKETGLWVDLWPCEYTTIDINDTKAIESFVYRQRRYKKKWLKNRLKMSREELFEKRKKAIPEVCDKQQAKSIAYCLEMGNPRLFEISTVFPLNLVKFEDYLFKAPNDEVKYLSNFYGEDYMSFPQKGVLSHGDDQGNLMTWARRSNTNMNEVINYLKSVLEELEGGV